MCESNNPVKMASYVVLPAQSGDILESFDSCSSEFSLISEQPPEEGVELHYSTNWTVLQTDSMSARSDLSNEEIQGSLFELVKGYNSLRENFQNSGDQLKVTLEEAQDKIQEVQVRIQEAQTRIQELEKEREELLLKLAQRQLIPEDGQAVENTVISDEDSEFEIIQKKSKDTERLTSQLTDAEHNIAELKQKIEEQNLMIESMQNMCEEKEIEKNELKSKLGNQDELNLRVSDLLQQVATSEKLNKAMRSKVKFLEEKLQLQNPAVFIIDDLLNQTEEFQEKTEAMKAEHEQIVAKLQEQIKSLEVKLDSGTQAAERSRNAEMLNQTEDYQKKIQAMKAEHEQIIAKLQEQMKSLKVKLDYQTQVAERWRNVEMPNQTKEYLKKTQAMKAEHKQIIAKLQEQIKSLEVKLDSETQAVERWRLKNLEDKKLLNIATLNCAREKNINQMQSRSMEEKVSPNYHSRPQQRTTSPLSNFKIEVKNTNHIPSERSTSSAIRTPTAKPPSPPPTKSIHSRLGYNTEATGSKSKAPLVVRGYEIAPRFQRLLQRKVEAKQEEQQQRRSQESSSSSSNSHTARSSATPPRTPSPSPNPYSFTASSIASANFSRTTPTDDDIFFPPPCDPFPSAATSQVSYSPPKSTGYSPVKSGGYSDSPAKSSNGFASARPRSPLQLRARLPAKTLSQQLDSAQSPREYVEIYARINNLPYNFSTKTIGQKKPNKGFVTVLTLGDSKHLSYPEVAQTELEAEEIAAEKAVKKIKESLELPETSISNPEEIQIFLNRIEELVCEKPSGMFNNGLQLEYESHYQEKLPSCWKDILKQSSIVEIDEIEVNFFSAIQIQNTS